ncbi:Uncharacterized protein TCM_037164 [Theobroma cacao]|uniref:Uncharacterized protein n=1 Tax=Theobroma cacao TaxID=3641 RepID=A0A061GJZ6_THECC|nr:Uncharacterized protein TCM_037164 [Theobroma cacao]
MIRASILTQPVWLAVAVDAGVVLEERIDEVEESGLSLAAAPSWERVTLSTAKSGNSLLITTAKYDSNIEIHWSNLSEVMNVAGLISTGEHGRSWWGNAGAIHDHVIGISLIVPTTESEDYGKIIQIGPQDIIWYPSRHAAAYRYDSTVSMDTPGDGLNDSIDIQPSSILFSLSVRATGFKAISRSIHKDSVVADIDCHRADDASTPRLNQDSLRMGLGHTGPRIGTWHSSMCKKRKSDGVDRVHDVAAKELFLLCSYGYRLHRPAHLTSSKAQKFHAVLNE